MSFYEHFSDEEIKELKRLRAKNALDLAIISPKRFENYHLATFVEFDIDLAFKIRVIRTSWLKNGVFRIDCDVLNLNIKAQIIFFHPKQFHLNSFKPNSTLFI